MTPRTGLALASLFLTVTVFAGNDDSAINAAREDLAARLQVPLERVMIDTEHRGVTQNLYKDCVRIGVPLEELTAKGSQLVLIVAGQRHYYYAMPGDSYRYCELPSTKKTGPIRAPVK